MPVRADGVERRLRAAVRDLIDLARRIEGCARHVSVHAAGVVITPEPLQELIPIAVSGKDEATVRAQLLRIVEPISGEVSITKYEAVPDRQGHVLTYKVWVHKE